MGQFSVEKPVLPGSVLSGNQHLAHFGELLIAPEAPDGVLLLGPGSGDRARALRARTALQSRIEDATRVLGAQYDFRALSHLDLNALQREWKLATKSNFLVRSGRQKKVRVSLNPYCVGPVPEDIGHDLIVLQDLRDLLAEAENNSVFRSAASSASSTRSAQLRADQGIVAWAAQMDATIRTLGARLDNAPLIFDHTVLLLTDYVDFVRPDGDAGRAFVAFRQSFEATLAGGAALSVSINLPAPGNLLSFNQPRME